MSLLSIENILEKLKILGFTIKNGSKSGIYYHTEISDLKVNINSKKIIYPEKIKLHDSTTTNFSKEENFVVLKCVIGLLRIGYKKEEIELEKRFLLGKKNSGKLDILIKNSRGKTYAMIECKTSKEIHKTWNKMIKGNSERDNQLFSYYQQDKNTKILMLYSFDFDLNKEMFYIIKCTDEMAKSKNLEETLIYWNKLTLQAGFFNERPFQTRFDSNLKRKDLVTIEEETSNSIFYSFLEILRKYSISDKPNAFNKIFNLFICKIVDENKNEDEELDFQWKNDDTYEKLLKRLNDLYKKGMKKFLNKNITDYSDQELNSLISENKELKIIFDELRLYKNNEFSFSEVFNKESFNSNSKIVKDVVVLLQNFQFRYVKKQPDLSLFFEKLLSKGFKQESGQFFTPVPIVNFIIKSLPIEQIMKKENNEKIIPAVLDYSCGSGHFLTEIMDEIQKIISTTDWGETNIPPESKKGLILEKLMIMIEHQILYME